MTTQTAIKPIDLNKEDLILKDFVVSDSSTFPSKKGNQLISIKLVGTKKWTTVPGLLYFGEREYQDIESLRGQKVNILLGAGDNGFHIKEVYPAV